MGWWRMRKWLSGPPFSHPSSLYLALRVYARGEQCVSRYTHLAHDNVYVTTHRMRYTMYTTGG